MINYIITILLVNILIFLFYGYFKTNWPEEYFGPDDKFSLAISVSFKRLILFRILPVFIICFFVYSYADFNISRNNWFLLGLITTLFYGLLTSGASIFKIISNSKTIKIFINKPNQIIYHLSSILFLSTIGITVGYILSLDLFMYLNDGVRSLIDDIIGALLYTAIIIPTYKFYRYSVDRSNVDIDSIIQKSIREIRKNKDLYNQIINTTKKYSANFDLVLAFCVVENIQRPRWFRNIENLWFLKSTKGIMQVTTKKPISDINSVKKAVTKYFKNSKDVKITEKYLRDLIRKYNGKDSEKYLLMLERSLSNIDFSCYNSII